MNLIIRTKDLKISPAIEDYIQKKINSLQKFAKNFNQDLAKIEVEVGKSTMHRQAGDIFRAEININIDGKMFRAESEKDLLYAAIDEVRDDLEQQIKKFKNKKETIFIRGARSFKKKFGISPLARFRKK